MEMEKRFFELWKRIGAQIDPTPVYELIVSHHSEPQRYYHNLKHIGHCFKEFDELLATAPDEFVAEVLKVIDPIELCFFTHDEIYKTKSAVNERKSFELTDRFLRRAGVSTDFRRRYASGIFATKHIYTPIDLVGKIAADADLAIFGQPLDVFDRYDQIDIRKEFAIYPDAVFNPGRIKVLNYFLGKPRIYHTEYFFEKYEEKARANLERSVKRLKSFTV